MTPEITILFIQFRLLDLLDILLVALLLYGLYNFVKGTVAINIFIGIISVYLIWQVVKLLQMDLLSEILGQFISVGVIALIVVFQPEIRKFLLMLGTPGFINKTPKRFLFWKLNLENSETFNIDPVVNACKNLAEESMGALIVITRNNELRQIAETGEIINARISEQLLKSIFFKNSPLHDGAVIIQNNQIYSARCILPLSTNTRLPSHYGLRHRAAVGITESSDALAIVVSEERGSIAYSFEGKIRGNIDAVGLKKNLERNL